ncbi:hypothetical protein M0R88_12680 [Halorussus gelatinilyticus]|uniref:Uncharacterized protein n=1 Tax=Halorussus gelatinilyticus TaxID=2937524 RepID=A0A8U0IEP2_9EURY|nr:hypothetical protein [Halorussus gelatinilyticus]UPV99377.1 hypothetical protein M0R88_12680 [Halorussus gelatinilyticus]
MATDGSDEGQSDRGATGRESADATADATDADPGIAAVILYGFVAGVGVLLLFDTVHNLTGLYESGVYAPGYRWIRAFLTAGLGSTCVLAGLSRATR